LSFDRLRTGPSTLLRTGAQGKPFDELRVNKNIGKNIRT